ncbi:hypothetical protein LCGC14_0468370 [marine sediment metagenome]|uniref:Uncharacterized protein n=1 Tax=marine sediment metagenome TaxID=412755 RepID=A0A0F9UZM6_9ZZZZ
MSDPISPMQAFKDNLARNLYGITAMEAVDKGVCIQCKEEALPKCYSEAGRKEYKISGLCEPCFDGITEIPEETEDEIIAQHDDEVALCEEAVRYGYHPIFALRENMKEAYDYALSVGEACGSDKAHVITAIHVMLNTHALAIARDRRVIRQLEEMARAALSYAQDGSRSDRRRMRMIEGAQKAIEAAKPYIEEGK